MVGGSRLLSQGGIVREGGREEGGGKACGVRVREGRGWVPREGRGVKEVGVGLRA